MTRVGCESCNGLGFEYLGKVCSDCQGSGSNWQEDE